MGVSFESIAYLVTSDGFGVYQQWMTKNPRKDRHPLYRVYHKMLHSARRDPHGFDERWLDFWLFVEDVGERPDGTILWRKNSTKPYGPDNWEWATKMKRMLLNMGPSYAQRYLQRQGIAIRAKVASSNCQASTHLFNQIKKKQG